MRGLLDLSGWQFAIVTVSLPFVLAFQACTYWVFRRQVMTPIPQLAGDVPGQRPPAAPERAAGRGGRGPHRPHRAHGGGTGSW